MIATSTLRNMTILALLAASSIGSLCAGQTTSQLVLEEIRSFPERLIGEWVVGDRTFIANKRTKFDLDHPARVGQLCKVEFGVVNGRAVATQIETQPLRADDPRLNDGPYVFWRDADTVEVIAFCDGAVRRETHDDVESAFDAPSLCGPQPTVHLDPAPPLVPRSSYDTPSRLLAVSDIEGNYDSLVQYLRNNGVIDGDGRWSWGDGHLLFNGDIVDRGDQVTETLWFIMRLEREARAAGGMVHYVLGNHEAMIMAGDLRYIHLKYRFTAGRLGLPYDALYDPATEIGRWLRSRNTVTRIGDVLYVHAGYSPALDSLGISLDAINNAIRSRLGPPAWPDGTDLATRLAWDMQGPMWYRGYFDEHAPNWGGRPTDEQIASILERNDVEYIVVGHTVVDDVGWLDAQERVVGIDVEWRRAGEAEGLLVENGAVWRLDMNGERRTLGSLQPAVQAP